MARNFQSENFIDFSVISMWRIIRQGYAKINPVLRVIIHLSRNSPGQITIIIKLQDVDFLSRVKPHRYSNYTKKNSPMVSAPGCCSDHVLTLILFHKKHITIGRERPVIVGDKLFKLISGISYFIHGWNHIFVHMMCFLLDFVTTKFQVGRNKYFK
jgi:hypothetical protein